jgi:CPA2 family monovalent cation:H+ antiporter-2
MPDASVIATLAGALAIALALGWTTGRLGLSTLVGYMLAGVVVGPYTPGFVADAQLAAQMAEIGVILLMFGVGMHFHPEELLQVRRIAVPGAIARTGILTVAGWLLGRTFGWSDGAGMVLGLALAVASTVVLMRMLVEQDRLGTHAGHVVVGWSIVEDLITVAVLVALPALAIDRAGFTAIAGALGLAAGKFAVFAALLWAFGTRLVAPIMERIARLRSTELFTLTVFVVAVGIAALAAEVFQMSVAMGAFFAGLVVGQSRIGPQAAADMAPFRDVFSALFFVSVGMLFNPQFVFSHPAMALGTLGIVLLLKPLSALIIAAMLGGTLRTGLTVAMGLAQIGEFSFILAALAQSLGVLPAEGMDLLVATALVSIAVNPLLFRGLEWIERRLAPPGDEGPERDAPEQPPGAREDSIPVAITGLGGTARLLAQRCSDSGLHVRVIGNGLDALQELCHRGIPTVFGDAGRQEVLKSAGVATARIIVVTNVSLPEKMGICIAARAVNPRIAIIATADSAAERAWLEEFGAEYVYDALEETTDGLVRAIRSSL